MMDFAETNITAMDLIEFEHTLEGDPEPVCANPEVISPTAIRNFLYVSDITFLICTFVSSLLQVYVMYYAIKHIRRRSSDKCMHVFLLSMTFADFILTGISYPAEFIDRLQNSSVPLFPKFINITIHMLTWIALIVSSLSLVFLNLDKLFYFRFPLRYSCFFTRTLSIFIACTLWIFSTLFISFAWVTNSFNCPFEDDNCRFMVMFNNMLHIYIAYVCLVSIMPTLTSLIVSIYIMKIVSTHRKQLAEEQALCQPATPGRSNSNTMMRSRMRTFYLIFIMTVFTALTLLPYRIASILKLLRDNSTQQDCLTILIYWVMMYMINLNSIINPVLTITVLPQYRMAFVNRCFFSAEERMQNGHHTTTTTVTVNGTNGIGRTSL